MPITPVAPDPEYEQIKFDANYNSNTFYALEILRKADDDKRREMIQNLKKEDALMQRVQLDILEDGSLSLCLYHPNDKDRLTHYILNRFPEFRAQGMTKKQYAKHFFNCTSSNLCNIITRESCPRDILITGALMMNPPLNARELDHALMEVGLPGLFTNTYDQSENIRNYVLTCFFEHVAKVNVRQHLVVWPEVADRVLKELDLEPLNRQNAGVLEIPDIDSSAEVQANLVNHLWKEIRPLVNGWLDAAEAVCKPVNYMKRRNEYLKNRLEALHLRDDDKRFFDKLTKAVCLNADSAKALFHDKYPISGTHSNHGDRDSLIRGAIFLRCTLDETNLLLSEANHAHLYVFRGNPEELKHIAALLQNEIDRTRAVQNAAP